MAIIHRAYYFDPTRFHALLREKIIDQDVLRLEMLHGWVQEIATNASEITRQTLENMRFDEEWLDTSDPEVSKSPAWYMIALASALVPAPSLSRHSKVTWLVLKQSLPFAEWTDSEITRLTRGNPLHTLVESSKDAVLIAEFYHGVDQFGGWLSLSDIEALLSHLVASSKQLVTPSLELEHALLELATLRSERSTEMLHEAYENAIEMLQTAIEHRSALFMILD